MDRYAVGLIRKPHGVRGAVKVGPLTDDVARFKQLKVVYIDNNKYNVEKAQINGDEVILTFKEVTSCDMAEDLRNKEIFVEKKDAVKLEEGRYFVVDIIGCEVEVDGKAIGKITEVLQHGAADVYVIKSKETECMVPALKKLLLQVDVDNKKIIFDKEVFEQVAVYED